MIKQCILEKIENTSRKRNENTHYYRLKIPVSDELKAEYADMLEDEKYLNLLFTKHQLALALKRVGKNPEDIVEHKNLFELLFDL